MLRKRTALLLTATVLTVASLMASTSYAADQRVVAYLAGTSTGPTTVPDSLKFPLFWPDLTVLRLGIIEFRDRTYKGFSVRYSISGTSTELSGSAGSTEGQVTSTKATAGGFIKVPGTGV